MQEITIIATALGIMTASLIGAFTINKTIGSFVSRQLPFLVSFGAGVLLFSAFFMTNEALHLVSSAWWVAALVVAGYFAAWALSRLIPHFHHHHDDSCQHKHAGGKRIIIGDGVHNIADGLVLVPAFMASPYLGFGIAFSIFIHELLQELSEFFVLKQAGYSTRRALSINFATSSTILLGVAIGLLFTATTLLQGVLLALSAGYFINLVIHDLLPYHHTRTLKERAVHTALIAIGVALVALVNQFAVFSHTHAEGEPEYEAQHAPTVDILASSTSSHVDHTEHLEEHHEHEHEHEIEHAH